MTPQARRGKRVRDPLPVESLDVRVQVDDVTDQLSTSLDTVHSELTCLLKAGMSEWGGMSIGCADHGRSIM